MPRKRADSAVTRRPPGRSRGRVRPPSGHRVGHTQTGRAPRALQEGSPRWGGFRLPSTPVPSRLEAFGAGGRVAAGWARPAVRGRVWLPQAASGTSDGGPRGTGAGAGRGSGRNVLVLQPVGTKALLKRSAANHLASAQGTATSAGHTSWGCCSARPPGASHPALGAERGHGFPTVPRSPPRARGPTPCPPAHRLGRRARLRARLCGGPVASVFRALASPPPFLYALPCFSLPFLFPPVAALHGVVYCDANPGKSLPFPAGLCRKARSLEIGLCAAPCWGQPRADGNRGQQRRRGRAQVTEAPNLV